MVLCFMWNNDIIESMKLWYDRKSKDPTYFVQLGIRNGKKTTTKNIARIGRHSELLKITDDPLSWSSKSTLPKNLRPTTPQPLPADSSTLAIFFSSSFTMAWTSAPFLMLRQPARRSHLTQTWWTGSLPVPVSSIRIPNSAHTGTWQTFTNSPGLITYISCGPWISWRSIMTNTSPTCLKKAGTS